LKTNIGLRYSIANVENKTYQSLQPRISLRYLITENWSAKAAWSVMNQNLNLLTGSSSVGWSMDVWVPATSTLKPQHSNIYSLGTLYAFKNNIEISSELFYKTMHNVLDYKDGTSYVFADNSWGDKIVQGKGISYGVEFLIEKKTGNTFGWLSYTLAKSKRQFDKISNGNWYPYQYDRRHNLNLVISHRFSEKFEIGATWIVSSGAQLTVNNQKFPSYLDQNKYIESYDSRNNFQMPLYHRLDLSLRFTKEKKTGIRTWSIGCYNVYNHKNPTIVYVENNKVNQLVSMPIIPSITYAFKFKKNPTIEKDHTNKHFNTESTSPILSPKMICAPEQTNKGCRMVTLGLNTTLLSYKEKIIFNYSSYDININIDFTLARFRVRNYLLGSVFTLSYVQPVRNNKEFNKYNTIYAFQYGILNRYYIGRMKIKPFIHVLPSLIGGIQNSQPVFGITVPFGVGISYLISNRISIEFLVTDNALHIKNTLRGKFGLQFYFK